MSFETDFSPIIVAITKFFVFIRRPDVQIQLIIFVGIIPLARSVSSIVKRRVPFLQDPAEEAEKRSTATTVFQLTRSIGRVSLFPLLVIGAIELIYIGLHPFGFTTGLLVHLTALFWTILAFKVGIALLYSFFDPPVVERNYRRLLFPLLVLLLVVELIGYLADMQTIKGIVLLELFGNPVTLGALFTATVGVYFWTDGVSALLDLLYRSIVRFSPPDPGAIKATLTLIRYGLILAGVVFALSQLRLDAATVAAITGGLSIGLGFGLREILSNFISGTVLMFERALHPGDVLELNGQLCVVESLSVRTTTVRTLDNIEHVVPNQTFFTESFKTYTGSDKTVCIPITVQTSCDNNIDHVMAILREAAGEQTDVLEDPAPTVLFGRFGDNVAEFQLNAWVDKPLKIPATTSEIRQRVWHAFHRHGIDLTFPDMALHFPGNGISLPVPPAETTPTVHPTASQASLV